MFALLWHPQNCFWNSERLLEAHLIFCVVGARSRHLILWNRMRIQISLFVLGCILARFWVFWGRNRCRIKIVPLISCCILLLLIWLSNIWIFHGWLLFGLSWLWLGCKLDNFTYGFLNFCLCDFLCHFFRLILLGFTSLCCTTDANNFTHCHLSFSFKLLKHLLVVVGSVETV